MDRVRKFIRGRLKDYIVVCGVLAGVTAGSLMVVPTTGYLSIGILYLLAVIALSIWVDRWLILLAAAVAALGWDYFFIPPVHTFGILSRQDQILFGMDVGVTLVASQLIVRVRNQARLERLRKDRATLLLQVSQALQGSQGGDESIALALLEMDKMLNATAALWVAREPGLLPNLRIGAGPKSPDEADVVERIWRLRTDPEVSARSAPCAESYGLPVAADGSALGVLVVRPDTAHPIDRFLGETIDGCASQFALHLERETLRNLREQEKILRESDRLYRVLFDALSHELKSPLTALSIITENIGRSEGGARLAMVQELKVASQRLRRMVNNLLDQTRLESGTLKPKIDWHSAVDIATAAIDTVKDSLGSHPLKVDIPPDLPLFKVDIALMEHVISNLLVNAILHTPEGTPISVSAGIGTRRDRAHFSVCDEGPGLPPELKGRLFRKFERARGARAGGLGLGLSIVNGFVAAQGGEVLVSENPRGGVCFTVSFPFECGEQPAAELD
jgi:two-component system sensor histidine kinase KdpD